LSNKIELIIFDLDGVLIDSRKNMMLSWKKVRASFNIKIPFKKYFENIGMPFDSILKKLEIKNNKNLIFNEYRKESIRNFKKLKLYPDVKKTLNILRKRYKLAIVTSKDKDRTSMILNKFNISFDCVICPEKNIRGKPYPDQIIKVLKYYKKKKNNSVYVGDMPVDYKAASRAGLKFIYAKYGYGKKQIFYKDYISKFSDIRKILV
jgi:phosphoglycolate phosphatase